MVRIISFLWFLLIFHACQEKPLQEVYRTKLVSDWEFKAATDSVWMPAKIPGVNFLDLMQNGVISNPYYSDEEKRVQWVGETDWWYRTRFNLPDSLFYFEGRKLVFEGLDTHADVWVNGVLKLHSDNMFRSYSIDIDQAFIPGENELLIRFHSPLQYNRNQSDSLPYRLPDERVFTRKAPYQFGWDWGPSLVTAGIYKPIFISCFQEMDLQDFYVSTLEIQPEQALMFASFSIESYLSQEVEVQLTSPQFADWQETFRLELDSGWNEIQWKFAVANPKLWWPVHYGEAFQYDFDLEVSSERQIRQASVQTGIRTIRLLQEKDRDGRSFFFEVNGLPVYAKGANYIPQDNFLTRVDSSRIERLIAEVLDANMNMIRVWGGGVYEEDYFYELCSQKGILVWQDFMFACAMYPGDEAFLETVEAEAIQQIRRLRKHSSLALWCGNNEVDNGWKDWGWQQQFNYSPQDEAQIYSDYQQLFESILPRLVREHHPGISYHPSSPTFGWGHPESLTEGDHHYWGVWWGMEPFERFNEKTGRFMSEYGFQAFPDWSLIEKYIPQEGRALYNPLMLSHQKHPTGNQTIEHYMNDYFEVPSDLQTFAYVSQLLQAHGMELAIRYHRIKKPYNMGTLYWQLNDCWPVVSWSSMDYHYNRKALHYRARDAFKTFMIGVEEADGEWFVRVNSDSIHDVNMRLEWQLIDFDGEVLAADGKDIQVPALSNQVWERILFDDLPSFNPRRTLWVGRLLSGDQEKARYLHYMVRPQDLELRSGKEVLQVSLEGDYLVLKASGLVKGLYVEGLKQDNYFDVLPGEELRYKWTESLSAKLPLVRSWNDTKKKSHP